MQVCLVCVCGCQGLMYRLGFNARMFCVRVCVWLTGFNVQTGV